MATRGPWSPDRRSRAWRGSRRAKAATNSRDLWCPCCPLGVPARRTMLPVQMTRRKRAKDATLDAAQCSASLSEAEAELLIRGSYGVLPRELLESKTAPGESPGAVSVFHADAEMPSVLLEEIVLRPGIRLRKSAIHSALERAVLPVFARTPGEEQRDRATAVRVNRTAFLVRKTAVRRRERSEVCEGVFQFHPVRPDQ